MTHAENVAVWLNDYVEAQCAAAASALADQLSGAQAKVDQLQERVAELLAEAADLRDRIAQLEAEAVPEPPAVDPLRFVDAHDMTSADRGLNAAGDYWQKNYRPAAGEGGQHAPYGGWSRDNPLPRESMFTGAGNWSSDGERSRAFDATSEIAWAKAAGLDGFLGNIMSPSGGNRDRCLAMAHAASEDGTFRYTPNLDCNSPSLAALTVTQTADLLIEVYATGCARKIGDRWMLSSFRAEKRTPRWWGDLVAELARRGYPVAPMLVFLDASPANMDAYSDVAWGYSVWGPAIPRNVASLATKAAKAHELGKVWMSPVRPQDTRPRSGVAAEAENTTLWRGLWEAANEHGDCVQVITWDDFAEHSHIEPSEGGGFAWTTLTRLYGDAFREQRPVHVDRDVVVITHRVHPHAAKPTGGQTKLMQWTLDGGGTPRDTVEALCILTQPATVSINDGFEVNVPAQTPTVIAAPLQVGQQSVGWRDQHILVSPHEVTDRPVVQDYHYKATVNA